MSMTGIKCSGCALSKVNRKTLSAHGDQPDISLSSGCRLPPFIFCMATAFAYYFVMYALFISSPILSFSLSDLGYRHPKKWGNDPQTAPQSVTKGFGKISHTNALAHAWSKSYQIDASPYYPCLDVSSLAHAQTQHYIAHSYQSYHAVFQYLLVYRYYFFSNYLKWRGGWTYTILL